MSFATGLKTIVVATDLDGRAEAAAWNTRANWLQPTAQRDRAGPRAGSPGLCGGGSRARESAQCNDGAGAQPPSIRWPLT